MLRSQSRYQLAGDDQCLLVCQRDGLSRFDGSYRGAKAGVADHGGQNHVDRLRLHDLGDGVCAGPYFDR